MTSATLSGTPGLVRSTAALAFAGLSYLAFLAVFLSFVAFMAGLLPGPAGVITDPWSAAALDVVLVLGFAVQHSVMARPRFKRWWTGLVPEPVERASYVLAASGMLTLVIAYWQPLPGIAWTVGSETGRAAVWAVFAFGWATVLFTTFLIDHFELFGLRQAWSYAIGRPTPDTAFKTPSLYRIVRHPMQLGFVIAFWAAPDMSAGRLALAALLTAYIVVALGFEERDLIAVFGEHYRDYQRRVPRLVPRPWSRRSAD